MPNLAIKRLVGEFSLVKDAAPVQPVYHKAVVILIENTFTLPKGQRSYRFQLIQANAGTRIQYAAVVENRAFPLLEDVECRLRMNYCYGSDDPYTLAFEPLNPQEAGFRRANVKWAPVESVPYDNLPYPDFPQSATWERLRAYPSTRRPNRKNDLVQWLCIGLNRIADEAELPRKTFSLISPLTPQDWRGEDGKRYATAVSSTEHGLVKLKLRETQFDKPKEVQKEILQITCSCKQDDESSKYQIIRLSDTDAKWIRNERGYCCFVTRVLPYETQKIAFYERNFEKGTFSPNADTISFSKIFEIKKDRETLSMGNAYWKPDRNGKPFCFQTVFLNSGEEKNVGFFQSQFLRQEDCPPPPGASLSFSVRERNGKYYAQEIVIGDLKSYTALNAVPGPPPECYLTQSIGTVQK